MPLRPITNSYIDLVDFICNSGSEDKEGQIVARILKKMSYSAPLYTDTSGTVYFCKAYKKHLKSDKYPEVVAMSIILESAISPISGDYFHRMNEVWSSAPELMNLFQEDFIGLSSRRNFIDFFAQKITVIKFLSRAASFEYSGVGNCSHRAAFSAMQLFQIFKNTDITVTWLRFQDINQCVVCLDRKKDGVFERYIYDPFTNPRLVFANDFYEREIKTRFAKSEPLGFDMQVMMSEKLLGYYAAKKDQVLQIIRSVLLDSESVTSNDNNICSLLHYLVKGFSVDDGPTVEQRALAVEKLERAITILREMIVPQQAPGKEGFFSTSHSNPAAASVPAAQVAPSFSPL